MRNLAIAGILLTFCLSGCSKKEGDTEGASGEAPAATSSPAGGGHDWSSGFDRKAELGKLEGTWQVRDTLSKKATWVIQGDKLTRKAETETEEGKIEIPHPGKVAFVQEKGGGTQRSYYGFARNGDDVYIGLGKAGAKLGDKYVIAADGGMVVLKGNSCKFFKKKMFEGFEKDALDVKCEIKDEGGKQVLAYEVPDSYRKGEMVQGAVQIVGDALLDHQMMNNKAEKEAAQ